MRLRANSEYVAIPAFALLMAALLFAVFLLAIGKSPLEFVDYVWRGGFGTAFSFQNTLQRSSPLILTALAVAIPARIGLIMIGGEGALVLGGFAAAAIAVPMVGVDPADRRDAHNGRRPRSWSAPSGSESPAISDTRAASTRRSRRCC